MSIANEHFIKQQALASSLVPFVITDLAGEITYANDAYGQLLGYPTADGLVGRSILDFWESADQTAELLQTLKANGRWQGDATLRRQDGGLRIVATSTSLVADANDTPLAMTASFIDITEQRRQQEALEINQRRLLEAERIGNIGHWEWEIATNALYWSAEVYRIFDLPADFEPSYPAFLERIHPDDRAIVETAVQNALNHQTPYQIEHRILRPNGEIQMVREQGRIHCDEQGQPQRMLGVVQDITFSKKADERIHFQSQLIQQIDDPIITLSEAGIIQSWNQAAVDLYGWSAEEAIGKHIGRLLQTDLFQNKASDPRRHMDAQGSWHGIQQQTTRSGQNRFVQISLSPVNSLFNPQVNWVIIGQDVTQQQKAYRALQTSQAQLQAIVDNAQEGILIVNDEGEFIEANPAALTLFGVTTPYELRQKTIWDISPADEMQMTVKIWEKFLTLDRQSGRHIILNQQGEKRQIEYLAIAHFLPHLHLMFFRDVTEREQQQRALQVSQTRLQAIVDNAQDGILIANDTGQYIEANPAALSLLGFNSVTGLQQSGLSSYVPTTPKQANSQPNTGQYTLIRHDGEKRDIEYRVVACVLPGLHLHFLRDVTQQRRQQLQQQKLTNALEQTADMVLITNKQGIIEYVNHAFTTITGYGREEVIGQPSAILKSGYHDRDFYKNMWGTILNKRNIHIVMVNKRKSGDLYYEDRTITPLLDEDGQITHFIASGRDITEQRQAQIALQQSDAFNRAILNSLPAHIAVLDEDGGIIATNEAWQQFGRENGIDDLRLITDGANYLNVCRDATGPYSQDSMVTYRGLSSVLTGQALRFDQEYPCPSPSQERWFLLRAVPLQDSSGRIIVTHTDITQSKLLEQQMETVYQFGQELVALQSEPDILNRFLEIVLLLFGSDLVGCGLVDKKRQELVYEYWASSTAEADCALTRFPLDGESCLGAYVIEQKQPLYIADATQNERYAPCANFHARSAYCVPIKAQEGIIGVVSAESRKKEGFAPDDRRFLNILTQQLGQALHNARLFAIEQQQAQNLAVLYQASRTIASSLNLSDVLSALLQEIKTLLAANIASALLYDEAQDHLYFAAVAGDEAHQMDQVRIWPNQSIAGWVLRHQEAALVDDAQEDPRFYRAIDEVTKLKTRALLAVPLTIGEQKLGVVEVMSQQAGQFSPQHLQLLQSLSGGAAVAIQNARLFATERELKEHLQRSQAQLVQAEKMTALGRLTASIAHEINNPLQSIEGFLTLLKENLTTEQENPKIGRYMGILEDEVERIAKLVKQMRDFYRPAQQERTPTDIHDILQSILTLSNKRIEHQGVTVQTLWEDGLPYVLSNPDHLKQVFLNLLLNALEAMENGGQLIVKTSLSVIESKAGEQPAVRIDFADSGHGIPPEMMPRLFEPFITTKETGTGLGLSISYNIVEAHGGVMLADSVINEGTTLTVLLPIL